MARTPTCALSTADLGLGGDALPVCTSTLRTAGDVRSSDALFFPCFFGSCFFGMALTEGFVAGGTGEFDADS